jgi:hypothetical protein
MSDQTPRDKAADAIAEGTGKTREQADAFLDLARSAFARRRWIEGEPLSDSEIGERFSTFMGGMDGDASE